LTSREEDVEALTSLGLTNGQAKVYLALVCIGTSTIRTVARASETPRQHVYKIILSLQNLGLVEKIISTPNKYRATPIQQGLYILLERKRQQITEARAKTTRLLKRYKEKNGAPQIQKEETDIVLFSGKEKIYAVTKEAIKRTQKNHKAICPWSFMRRANFNDIEAYTKAIERGVKYQVIIDKPENKKTLSEITGFLKKHPNYEIRYVQPFNSIKLQIADDKEMHLWILDTFGQTIWSNNKFLVQLAQGYFESLWNRATTIQT